MMKNYLYILFIIAIISCKSDSESYVPYQNTAYILAIPQIFADKLPNPVIPNSNPFTVEGVALGKKLFYDPILSGDGTQSCASCHKQVDGFTDDVQFSVGIDNIEGNRNSMPLFNMAWNLNEKFFWDGRSIGLESQALDPVTNVVEMHNTWQNAIHDLKNSSVYQDLFNKAFPEQTAMDTNITKELVAKAIAQFERTIISANSKFDKYLNGEVNLTVDELEGFNIFNDERGDCFHCHGTGNSNPLWTDNIFRNNGLDAIFTDIGLEEVTGDPNDRGKFKTPSLRNLVFTAPYMHDGRFTTLDEVINHYSEGVINSSTIDTQMLFVAQGGTQMSTLEKAQLKAFLLTLTDNEFITNPDFQE
ncbi:MAG: cytochrome-c peroxidase [Flavobacteriaceae bacterium]|nr:cytochrome-c peroxidase [Flavobacteriaceae bacterium]